MLALAAAETRTHWRSTRCRICVAAIVAAGLGAYYVLARQHAELWVFGSAPGLVSPRFLVHTFGVAPFSILLISIALFAFDSSHRDQGSRIAETLEARPHPNLAYTLGRFLGLLATGAAMLLLAHGALHTFGMLARAFDWQVGEPIEPLSHFAFVVVDALPALAGWCALVLLLTVAARNRALILLLAIGLLASLHWLLHSVPTYLLPVVSPLPGFGTLASDVLPTFPDLSVLVQRVLVLLLGAAMLAIAAAIHPRADGRRSWRLAAATAAAACALAGSAGLTLLVARSSDAIALRDRWHAAQRAMDGTPRANLERIEGSVQIEPGRALTLDLELTLAAPSEGSPLGDLVFSFNPAMRVRRLMLDGTRVAYRHEYGLLVLEPQRTLAPGTAFVVSLGATGIPDPGFAYLDEAVDAAAESWANSQLPFLGTVASVFENDYVALMPGTRWYPHPGPNLAADGAHGTADHFAIDLEVESPAGWHVAAPGRGQPTGDPRRLRFRPSGPLAEVTIMAAPFARYVVVVEGVEFQLLLHPAHARNAELLANVAGLKEAIVGRLADFLRDARRYGIPYPYDGMSIVEVPARLRLYRGGWRMDGLQSLPGILLMREHGFPTAQLNRALLLNARVPALDKLNNLLQYFVQDRAGGNLLAGATHNLLPFLIEGRGDDAGLAQSLLASLTSLQFGIRPLPFTAHAFTNTPLSRTGARANLDAPGDRLAAFASGVAASYHEAVGWDLEHPSLWQRAVGTPWAAIAPGDDPHHALATKSLLANVIALTTWYTLGRDGVAGLLERIRSRHEGGPVTIRDLVAAAQQDAESRLYIEEWANTRPAPGIVASAVEVRRLGGVSQEAGYRISLKVHNEEAAPGMVRLVIGTDPGNDSAWLRRQSSEPVAVGGHSSVELGMNSAAAPLDAWLATYFSQNRSDMRLALTEFDATRPELDEAPGSRPTSWHPAPQVGIVVDDLDPGFAVESARPDSPLTTLLARKDDGMLLDRGIRAYRQALGEAGHMPESGVSRPGWSRQEFGAAWGRYRRTLVRAVAGDGLERAVFTTLVPTTDRWHLDYHIPDTSPKPRRTGIQSWTIIGDWDGGHVGTHHLTLATLAAAVETTVVFDVDAATPGWNRVGTFELAAGEVRLTVSNRSSGETVIADAIRWTRTEGPPSLPDDSRSPIDLEKGASKP